MKLVKGRRSLFLLAAIITLLVLASLSWVVRRNNNSGSQENLVETLDSEKTKNELSQGNCSDDTKSSLATINESSEPAIVAKAYETRGLCLVYADDQQGAKNAYIKAKEFYEKAEDTEGANRVQRSVDAIDAMEAEKALDKPGPDADPKQYPESPGGI